MELHDNTVWNMNHSAAQDILCGQEQMSLEAFKEVCGVDVGTSREGRPVDDEIMAMVRRWLRTPGG